LAGINIGLNNSNVPIKYINIGQNGSNVKIKHVNWGNPVTQSNVNVWNAYDAQGHNHNAASGGINADGSISYDGRYWVYGGSNGMLSLFYLQFDTPIHLIEGQTVLSHLPITFYLETRPGPTAGWARLDVYDIPDLNTGHCIFGYEFPDGATAGTLNPPSTAGYSGDYSKLYFTFTYNYSQDWDNQQITLSAAAGCWTLGGKQLNDIELI